MKRLSQSWKQKKRFISQTATPERSLDKTNVLSKQPKRFHSNDHVVVADSTIEAFANQTKVSPDVTKRDHSPALFQPNCSPIVLSDETYYVGCDVSSFSPMLQKGTACCFDNCLSTSCKKSPGSVAMSPAATNFVEVRSVGRRRKHCRRLRMSREGLFGTTSASTLSDSFSPSDDRRRYKRRRAVNRSTICSSSSTLDHIFCPDLFASEPNSASTPQCSLHSMGNNREADIESDLSPVTASKDSITVCQVAMLSRGFDTKKSCGVRVQRDRKSHIGKDVGSQRPCLADMELLPPIMKETAEMSGGTELGQSDMNSVHSGIRETVVMSVETCPSRKEAETDHISLEEIVSFLGGTIFEHTELRLYHSSVGDTDKKDLGPEHTDLAACQSAVLKGEWRKRSPQYTVANKEQPGVRVCGSRSRQSIVMERHQRSSENVNVIKCIVPPTKVDCINCVSEQMGVNIDQVSSGQSNSIGRAISGQHSDTGLLPGHCQQIADLASIASSYTVIKDTHKKHNTCTSIDSCNSSQIGTQSITNIQCVFRYSGNSVNAGGSVGVRCDIKCTSCVDAGHAVNGMGSSCRIRCALGNSVDLGKAEDRLWKAHNAECGSGNSVDLGMAEDRLRNGHNADCGSGNRVNIGWPDDTLNGENKSEFLAIESALSLSANKLAQDEMLLLSWWGLPEPVLTAYRRQGITRMLPWQAECLMTGNALRAGNLIFSAPTSAGKTLVVEVLMLKRVLERRCKVLFILPFVSVCREKMVSLQLLFEGVGVRVGGFMGSHSPVGGLQSVDVAVCTIEKANGLINRLMENNSIHEIGMVVVDELHMVGDPNRGYLLELLLSKVMYLCNRTPLRKVTPVTNCGSVQVVGMSATLPNLGVLASWLGASLYHTDFRPVPLTEYIKVGTTIFDRDMQRVRDIDHRLTFPDDGDHIVPLCLETVLTGHSVLIFCPTKAWCERLAVRVARKFSHFLSNPNSLAMYTTVMASDHCVDLPVNRTSLMNVLEQLSRSPVGVDPSLAKAVQSAVAYHHAGLTFDERDIIEDAFRNGYVKVLVATSTISSGVNLPARRVIIRSPKFAGRMMSLLSYRQMAGRAGRLGQDTEGECILVCQEHEVQMARSLLSSDLHPVTSCLASTTDDQIVISGGLKRAILEVVVSGMATTPSDVASYVACTLMSGLLSPAAAKTDSIIRRCLDYLKDNEFVISTKTTTTGGEEGDGMACHSYKPSQLGSAVFSSSMSPDEGLVVFAELQRARQCFVLASELYVVYLVTPLNALELAANINWYHYYCLWESLSPDHRLVAGMVGVEEAFLACAISGHVPSKTPAQLRSLAIHRRFYMALAMHDLVQERPLLSVCSKYHCNKGQLQSLMQSAAKFAGMVTVFCGRLGWTNMELLMAQFQQRFTLGIAAELCDLVRIPLLTGSLARMLFSSGYLTLTSLALAVPDDLEVVFRNSSPFSSTRQQDGETSWDVEGRRRSHCMWLVGLKAVTEFEAAQAIIAEAKLIIQQEVGVSIEWKHRECSSGIGRHAEVAVGGDGGVIGPTCDKTVHVSKTIDRHCADVTAVRFSYRVESDSGGAQTDVASCTVESASLCSTVDGVIGDSSLTLCRGALSRDGADFFTGVHSGGFHQLPGSGGKCSFSQVTSLSGATEKLSSSAMAKGQDVISGHELISDRVSSCGDDSGSSLLSIVSVTSNSIHNTSCNMGSGCSLGVSTFVDVTQHVAHPVTGDPAVVYLAVGDVAREVPGDPVVVYLTVGDVAREVPGDPVVVYLTVGDVARKVSGDPVVEGTVCDVARKVSGDPVVVQATVCDVAREVPGDPVVVHATVGDVAREVPGDPVVVQATVGDVAREVPADPVVVYLTVGDVARKVSGDPVVEGTVGDVARKVSGDPVVEGTVGDVARKVSGDPVVEGTVGYVARKVSGDPVVEGTVGDVAHEVPADPVVVHATVGDVAHEVPADPVVVQATVGDVAREVPADPVVVQATVGDVAREVPADPVVHATVGDVAREVPADPVVVQATVGDVAREVPADPVVVQATVCDVAREVPGDPVVVQATVGDVLRVACRELSYCSPTVPTVLQNTPVMLFTAPPCARPMTLPGTKLSPNVLSTLSTGILLSAADDGNDRKSTDFASTYHLASSSYVASHLSVSGHVHCSCHTFCGSHSYCNCYTPFICHTPCSCHASCNCCPSHNSECVSPEASILCRQYCVGQTVQAPSIVARWTSCCQWSTVASTWPAHYSSPPTDSTMSAKFSDSLNVGVVMQATSHRDIWGQCSTYTAASSLDMATLYRDIRGISSTISAASSVGMDASHRDIRGISSTSTAASVDMVGEVMWTAEHVQVDTCFDDSFVLNTQTVNQLDVVNGLTVSGGVNGMTVLDGVNQLTMTDGVSGLTVLNGVNQLTASGCDNRLTVLGSVCHEFNHPEMCHNLCQVLSCEPNFQIGSCGVLPDSTSHSELEPCSIAGMIKKTCQLLSPPTGIVSSRGVLVSSSAHTLCSAIFCCPSMMVPVRLGLHFNAGRECRTDDAVSCASIPSGCHGTYLVNCGTFQTIPSFDVFHSSVSATYIDVTLPEYSVHEECRMNHSLSVACILSSATTAIQSGDIATAASEQLKIAHQGSTAAWENLGELHDMSIAAGENLRQLCDVSTAAGGNLRQLCDVSTAIGENLGQSHDMLTAAWENLGQLCDVSTAAGESLGQLCDISTTTGDTLIQICDVSTTVAAMTVACADIRLSTSSVGGINQLVEFVPAAELKTSSDIQCCDFCHVLRPADQRLLSTDQEIYHGSINDGSLDNVVLRRSISKCLCLEEGVWGVCSVCQPVLSLVTCREGNIVNSEQVRRQISVSDDCGSADRHSRSAECESGQAQKNWSVLPDVGGSIMTCNVLSMSMMEQACVDDFFCDDPSQFRNTETAKVSTHKGQKIRDDVSFVQLVHSVPNAGDLHVFPNPSCHDVVGQECPLDEHLSPAIFSSPTFGCLHKSAHDKNVDLILATSTMDELNQCNVTSTGRMELSYGCGEEIFLVDDELCASDVVLSGSSDSMTAGDELCASYVELSGSSDSMTAGDELCASDVELSGSSDSMTAGDCIPPTPPSAQSDLPMMSSCTSTQGCSLPGNDVSMAGGDPLGSPAYLSHDLSPVHVSEGTITFSYSRLSKLGEVSEGNCGECCVRDECNVKVDDIEYDAAGDVCDSEKGSPQHLVTGPAQDSLLSIVDVCSNVELFNTFLTEWRHQPYYAIALACEKSCDSTRHSFQNTIGANFLRTLAGGQVNVEGELVTAKGLEIPGDKQRAIVGLSVCWTGTEAYYVSLSELTNMWSLFGLAGSTQYEDNDVDDDSLSEVLPTQSLSVCQRLESVNDVLRLTKDTSSSHWPVVYDALPSLVLIGKVFGVVLGRCQDPRVACWLLDPSARQNALHSMVANYTPEDLPVLRAVWGSSGHGCLDLNGDGGGSGRLRSVVDSIVSRSLMDHLRSKLSECGLEGVFGHLEMPTIVTLCKLELNGFGFSSDRCLQQQKDIAVGLRGLERQAYRLAGHAFSFTSLTDVTHVLYRELHLPIAVDARCSPVGVRRGCLARGRRLLTAATSTKDNLQSLRCLHPLPGIILDWRHINYLLSNHLLPLRRESVWLPHLNMMRIYGQCQTLTATGRIIISDPTLQHVPKDIIIDWTSANEGMPSDCQYQKGHSSSVGSGGVDKKDSVWTASSSSLSSCHLFIRMRRLFLPFEGAVILSADYSQLELRLIAHLSADSKLLSILNNDGDVFKMIAADWKNISVEDVSAEQRQQAKQVCYGMLYGIGAHSLGQQMSMDEKEAAVFMESFKAKYGEMTSYMRQTVTCCRQKGYVTTVAGRRRYLPAIVDNDSQTRAQAERQAINTTVQGSAADIAKMAMNNIDARLTQLFPDSVPHTVKGADGRSPVGAYLVLNLHDELVYEVTREHLLSVARMIKLEMENVMQLSVMLPVKVKVGPSWGTLEEYQFVE